MKKIILASGSPRRKELLEKIGLKFEVAAGDIEEDLNNGLPPRKLAEKLSLDKAGAAALKYSDAVIIAADTLGVFEGKIIGKPHTPSVARKMLSMLSGKMHLVITGYTILDTGTRKSITKSVTTKVYFRRLTEAEIEAYVKTGEPLDKAGAYAIQGLGALIVEKIEGDYYNVIGLPLSSLMESLKEFGVKVL
jgi:septum formation protein